MVAADAKHVYRCALRFAERHSLTPGQTVHVEGRDAAADSVRLRGDEREMTIGARAASKVLVQSR